MNPTKKAEELEQFHHKAFGFDRRAVIKSDKCAPKPFGCGGDATQFDDDVSLQEYRISGLCQKCQDSFFGRRRKPKEPKIDSDEFLTEGYQMLSGQADAQARRYRKIEDKMGHVWLVALQEAAAENIYVHDPREKNSQGFAGSTLAFTLEDGSVYQAQGPWHTNADSLFSATGVDVRDTHRTFVVLAKERDYLKDSYRTILRGIIYKDEKPVLGRFDRYKDLIKQYPEAQFYYMQSHGGSSCGPCESYRK